jgi:hypothetical protein
MTGTEFNEWLEAHFAAFPRLGKLIGDMSNVGAIVALWSRELAAAELEDALEVTRRMARGAEGFVPPRDFHEHELPTFLMDRCDAVRTERLLRELHAKAPELVPAKGKPMDLVKLSQKVAAAVAQGKNAYQISREMYPLSPDEERSYRCLICEDTGLALVWSNQSMAAAENGTLTPDRGCSRVAVRCSCSRGDLHEAASMKDPTQKDGKRKTPNIYNDEKFLTWEHYEDGRRYRGNTPEGVERLVEFMRSRVPNHGCVQLEY